MIPISAKRTDREMHLLLRCASIRADRYSHEIRSMISGGVDWAHLVRLARYHLVVPLLRRTLACGHESTTPKHVFEQLNAYCAAVEQGNRNRLDELLSIARAFDDAGVPLISYKGPLLGILAYGDLSLRHFSDLDLLVRETDVAAAKSLLVRFGYQRATEQQHECQFAHAEAEKPRVDLHWQIVQDDIQFDIVRDGLWERTSTTTIAGTTITTPRPVDLMVILIMHGTRHGWRNLKFLCDIAELGRSREIDWEDVVASSRRLGCERSLHVGFHLASLLLDAQVPDAVARSAAADATAKFVAVREANAMLDARSVRKRFDKKYLAREVDFFIHRVNRGRMYTRPMHWIRRRVRIAFRPTERDRNFVKLPECLSFMYLIVRPTRVVVEYVLGRRISQA